MHSTLDFLLNFNFLLLSLVLASGCGVKSAPIPPANTQLPSVEKRYSEQPILKEASKKNKNENEKEANKND